jgi:hypothetical protein
MKIVIQFLILLCIIGCSSSNPPQVNTKAVSLIRLISNPQKYHKKDIIISGYFTVQFEEHALYLTKEDYETVNVSNAVLLSTDKELLRKYIDPPYKGYITIRGIFNKNKTGGNKMFNGTLENISFAQRVELRGSR